MNEEEKKAYNYYKECNVNDLSRFDYFSEVSKVSIKYMETLLNLIEKQQAEIERLKQIISKTSVQFINDTIETDKKNKEDLEMLYRGCQAEIETLKRDFEMVDHECSRLEKEDIKKDLIINLMAEQLTTPYHSKEWVIDYYKREIEK